MKFFLCLDDTDNINSIGTGALVEMIKRRIHEDRLGSCHHITRHQLFISPEIPYTSHNSAMCLEGEAPKQSLPEIKRIALEILNTHAAHGSDPGFCMVVNPTEQTKQMLIQFGKRATQEVLTKEQAYDLAIYLNITLSEHGGTGQGVIGALAGIGLRISGQHGEAKGILKKVNHQRFTVGALKVNHEIERVETIDGQKVDDLSEVYIYDATKIVLKDHRFTLLVREGERYLMALDKKIIRQTQMGPGFSEISDVSSWVAMMDASSDDAINDKLGCSIFLRDTDEECIDSKSGVCYNCQYRRWEAQGFKCLKNRLRS